MYKVNKSMLPEGVQRMFQTQTNRYEPCRGMNKCKSKINIISFTF